MHLFQQRILVLPHLIDPALKLQSILTVLVVVLADELWWNLQLFKMHHHIRNVPAQQIPETRTPGRVVDGHDENGLQLFAIASSTKTAWSDLRQEQ